MTTTTAIRHRSRAPSAGRPLRTVALLTGTELRLLGARTAASLVGLIAFPAVTVLILAGVFGSDP